tara:strand:- start:162 stop:914 length:753 start_codon:yes stop_codon:yes gene_type:complete
MAIVERDGRDPQANPLRPIGGISACAVGDLARAQRLAAQHGWLPAFAVDKHLSTPLMWAAGGGHLPVVRWLVEAQRVGVDATNRVHRTALHWACKTGQCAVARYLLEEAGADVHARMKDESTAFDWAVHSGDLPTMELLARHPSVDVAAMNRFGCAAVHWAAAAGNVASLRWLQRKGLELGHVNAAGHGAVAKAAWKGHLDALKWLLVEADGPRLVAQLALRDSEGRSVAEVVRDNGQHQVAEWLSARVQ